MYFITVCAYTRRPMLAAPNVADILRTEWEAARVRRGWLAGRCVIMPDHVHFFCAEKVEGSPHRLSRFIGMERMDGESARPKTFDFRPD